MERQDRSPASSRLWARARWSALLFFGIPSLVATVGVYLVLPALDRAGVPLFWNHILSVVSAMPLMFVAAFAAYRLEGRPLTWAGVRARFRLAPIRGPDRPGAVVRGLAPAKHDDRHRRPRGTERAGVHPAGDGDRGGGAVGIAGRTENRPLLASILAEDVGHHVSHPIRGLPVARESSHAIQMIAQGDDGRFLYQSAIVTDNLAQPHTGDKAVTEAASILGVARQATLVDKARDRFG